MAQAALLAGGLEAAGLLAEPSGLLEVLPDFSDLPSDFPLPDFSDFGIFAQN